MPLDTRAMDGALGVTDRPGISAARSGPMDAVQSSLTAADVLADEVRALVDDLLGPVPEKVNGESAEPYSGRLHSLAYRARSINDNVTRACDALVRLRAAL